jgi:hypothetical protein
LGIHATQLIMDAIDSRVCHQESKSNFIWYLIERSLLAEWLLLLFLNKEQQQSKAFSIFI